MKFVDLKKMLDSIKLKYNKFKYQEFGIIYQNIKHWLVSIWTSESMQKIDKIIVQRIVTLRIIRD